MIEILGLLGMVVIEVLLGQVVWFRRLRDSWLPRALFASQQLGGHHGGDVE